MDISANVHKPAPPVSIALTIRRLVSLARERAVRELPSGIRVVIFATGAILRLLAGAVLYVYAKSDRILRQSNDVPLQDITVPSDKASIAEGWRPVRIRGCNGATFQGHDGSPNLPVMVGTYPIEQFTTLMQTGKAAGNRELVLKSGVSRSRFAYFTDGEIAALYAFLRSQSRWVNEVHTGTR